jgi:hypothetical protein
MWSNVMFLLLPYLEQQNVYNLGVNITADRTMRASESGVRQTIIKTFICPSDWSAPGTEQKLDLTARRYFGGIRSRLLP